MAKIQSFKFLYTSLRVYVIFGCVRQKKKKVIEDFFDFAPLRFRFVTALELTYRDVPHTVGKLRIPAFQRYATGLRTSTLKGSKLKPKLGEIFEKLRSLEGKVAE